MAVYALTSPKLYVGPYEVTGDLNSFGFDLTNEVKDSTTFGNTSRTKVPGLSNVELEMGGYTNFDASKSDAVFSSILGGTSQVTTIAPTTGAVGEAATICRSIETTYEQGGSVGDMHEFSASIEGTDLAVAAKVLGASATAYTSGATNGTGVQVGAASADQTVYAALHVITAGATNVIVKIQSDDNSDFSSATDRITFTTATGVTSEWKSLAGAVTDDYWRIVATVTGLGTWNLACSLGIK